MEVLRLNPTTYLPDSLVEGYTSMIWTERYLENGEFEMKTPKVSETKALIPENSMLSLLDTQEVMFVETHSIGRDSNGISELTVKGRTFETFLQKLYLQDNSKEAKLLFLEFYTAKAQTRASCI